MRQNVPFDKELSKSMNRTNAKRQFIDTYGESNSYLIYDFEKCKGNRLKEDVILLVLINMGVSSYIFRNLFNVGLSRLERISGKKNRYNEVLSDDCRQDIDKFLKRAPLYRHCPCSHQEFVLFIHPIHNFHDACEQFEAVTGKSINIHTFQKNLQKYGGKKTSFMCRRPKYFPICGECDNEESFVSKTCVSDRINPPCVLGHQSDPLDIAHDQAEDNNLLNGESIAAEHIDL